MRTVIHLIVFLTFTNESCIGQDVFEPDSSKLSLKKHFTYEMNAIAFGMGVFNSRIEGDLNKERKFIVENIRTGSFCFSFLEFRMFFKDKIGLNGGFNFYQAGINTDYIMSKFPGIVTDYKVSFNGPDDHGLAPVQGSFDCLSLETGIIGKINVKNISILPFVNYLHTVGSNKYYLDANYEGIDNSETFSRSIKLTEKINYALKFGLDVRYNFRNSLFLGLKSAYSLFNVAGISTIRDDYSDGTEIMGEEQSYAHFANVVSFQLFVGVKLGK